MKSEAPKFNYNKHGEDVADKRKYTQNIIEHMFGNKLELIKMLLIRQQPERNHTTLFNFFPEAAQSERE